MRDRIHGLPGTQMEDRLTLAIATCTVGECHGILDVFVLPFHKARYPGEVQIRCSRCHTVETPAMRVKSQEAPKKYAHPEKAPALLITCRRSACTRQFKPRRKSVGQSYCSRLCQSADRAETNARRTMAAWLARQEEAA